MIAAMQSSGKSAKFILVLCTTFVSSKISAVDKAETKQAHLVCICSLVKKFAFATPSSTSAKLKRENGSFLFSREELLDSQVTKAWRNLRSSR
jgi:hypothetical protein